MNNQSHCCSQIQHLVFPIPITLTINVKICYKTETTLAFLVYSRVYQVDSEKSQRSDFSCQLLLYYLTTDI